MPSYHFPELTPAQIVTSLSDFCNITLEESDIKKAEASVWQEIFMRVMCAVTGAQEDVFLEQPLWASSMFEYPELHSDSVPIMQIIVVMEKYMPKLGVMDFNGMDVISPTPRRLITICSAAINFLRFKEIRLFTFDQIKSDVEQGLAKQGMLLKKNQELHERIQQAQEDRVQQEPELVKIQESIDQTTLKINELQKTKTQLKKRSGEIKAQYLEKKAFGDQQKLTILKTKEEMEKLSLKIVQSPEKMQSEREHLELQLKNLYDELQEKRVRLSKIQKMREMFKQDGQDAEKGLQLLEAIQASINKESDIAAEIGQITDQIEDKAQANQALTSTKMQVQRVLSTRQEKLAKLTMQHHSRIKVLKEQYQQFVKDRDSCHRKGDSETAHKSRIAEYRARAEREVKEEKKLVHERIQQMQEMYSQLLEKFEQQSQSIAVGWAEVRKVLRA